MSTKNAVGVCGAMLLMMVGERAMAQAPPPAFVPGDLIIGYNKPGDRGQAVRELNAAKDAFKVRGKTVDRLAVQTIGNSALKLHIDLPTDLRGQTANDPALELQILRETASRLKEVDKRVKYVHPNWILGINPVPPRTPIDVRVLNTIMRPQGAPAAGVPNDYAFVRGLQWDFAPPPMGMNAITAWKSETGSRDVVVAVLDTGILLDHPDMQDSGNILPGYNFVTSQGRGSDPTDPGDTCLQIGEAVPSWHGTHVAGTIGAVGSNNQRGIAAINWKVSLLPVRVVGHCGAAFADIAAGLLWAAGLPVDDKKVPLNPKPAHVINLSLGGPLRCNEEQAGLLTDALKSVRAAGVVVVASAGNDGMDVGGVTPAGCAGVISVVAGDRDGHLAPYSNYGDASIMAPGGDMKVNDENGLPIGVWSAVKVSSISAEGIEPQQGTSMAAPHVSGAIALALAKHPDWRRKPDLIEQKLRASAVPFIQDACNHPCGPGQLDAMKLIEAP